MSGWGVRLGEGEMSDAIGSSSPGPRKVETGNGRAGGLNLEEADPHRLGLRAQTVAFSVSFATNDRRQ